MSLFQGSPLQTPQPCPFPLPLIGCSPPTILLPLIPPASPFSAASSLRGTKSLPSHLVLTDSAVVKSSRCERLFPVVAAEKCPRFIFLAFLSKTLLGWTKEFHAFCTRPPQPAMPSLITLPARATILQNSAQTCPLWCFSLLSKWHTFTSLVPNYNFLGGFMVLCLLSVEYYIKQQS